MKELDDLRSELTFGTRLLLLKLGSPWGHIAARLPESDKRKGFMLKHIRVAPPPADPESVMIFDYDGNLLEGERMIPWEIHIYTNVFKTRPEIQSAIHTHPDRATALTMAGKTVFAISHRSAQFEHGIPVIPGDVPLTNELGARLTKALSTWPGILMKGHGAVTVGGSIGHAVQHMLCLEQAARQQIWAATVGTPEVLDDAEIEFQKNPPAGDGSLAYWHTLQHFYGKFESTSTKKEKRTRMNYRKNRSV